MVDGVNVVLRAIARSLSPSALSRKISLTLRIGTLSAGIGSLSLTGQGAYAVQPEIERPPPTGVAEFK